MSSRKTSERPGAPTKKQSGLQKASNLVAEPPSFWIIGGANGSGKTTSYNEARVTDSQGSVWIINPDLLAAKIAEIEGVPNDEANRQAVIRIENWLEASIEAHQTVGVETVMSTSKYRRLVERARYLGFRIRLVYVVLRDAKLNVSRVAARVAKGGHDVPEAKIISRRGKSFGQLEWFFQAADVAFIFDNSGAEPSLLVSKENDEIAIHGPLIKELVDALRPAIPDIDRLLQNVD